MSNHSPSMRNVISRGNLLGQIKNAKAQVHYWTYRKATDLKAEDRLHAGGLVIAWEGQLKPLEDKLASIPEWTPSHA
jgi:hypothetical protein